MQTINNYIYRIHPRAALAIVLVGCLIISSCDMQSSELGISSDTGTGGSLARFAIVENYLYVVDVSSLKQYDIADPANIQFVRSIDLQFGVETIFPRPPYLYIGTQTGMYIYEMQPDGDLGFTSHYQHILSCDPVVANDTMAFVTLRNAGSDCGIWRGVNELHVVSLENITAPREVAIYPMDEPKGLGLGGHLLFLCDGDNLKIFDATDPLNLTLAQQFSGTNPTDVIPIADIAMVISPDNLRQYNYAAPDSVYLVSSLSLD